MDWTSKTIICWWWWWRRRIIVIKGFLFILQCRFSNNFLNWIGHFDQFPWKYQSSTTRKRTSSMDVHEKIHIDILSDHLKDKRVQRYNGVEIVLDFLLNFDMSSFLFVVFVEVRINGVWIFFPYLLIELFNSTLLLNYSKSPTNWEPKGWLKLHHNHMLPIFSA